MAKNGLESVKRQTKKSDTAREILSVMITGTQRREVLKKIYLQRKEMLHVATVNPEYIMEARSNPRFKSILAQCLTVADGHGVVWASRILGNRKQEAGISQFERISGTELSTEMLQHASEKAEKVFLLGGQPHIAVRAAAEMSKKYPNLQIWGYEGARSVAREQNEESSVTIAKINAVGPDYLLVAYGSPWQDIWIEENRAYLRVRVAMGVGGVLDEWAGVVKPCPEWIDGIGMKWLWRVVHEPWRWKRILRVLQFGGLVLWLRFKQII